MKDKKKLKNKIVQSIFMYETKRLTIETVIKTIILLISGGIILVFGGVITDISVENEMGGLMGDFLKSKDYSVSKILELSNVVLTEIPRWVVLSYAIGLVLGCILILSIIRNWKPISHKIRSIVHYWLKL